MLEFQYCKFFLVYLLNIQEILLLIKSTFNNKSYISKLKTSQKNWLDEELEDVLSGIVSFLETIT